MKVRILPSALPRHVIVSTSVAIDRAVEEGATAGDGAAPAVDDDDDDAADAAIGWRCWK